MNSPWILIDGNNVCHRSWHGITYNRTSFKVNNKIEKNAVAKLLFRCIWNLRREYGSSKIIVAFDSEQSHRKLLYSDYKAGRIENLDVQKQIKEARNLAVKGGVLNVYEAGGYEADDILGQMVQMVKKQKDKAIIYSSDKDLYQLLTPDISIKCPGSPSRFVHMADFEETYGIPPYKWPMMKAIMGDSSDNIPGIEGIGPVNAAKLIRGETVSRRIQLLYDGNRSIVERNLKLVTLPYSRIDLMTPQENGIDTKKWNQVISLDLAMPNMYL